MAAMINLDNIDYNTVKDDLYNYLKSRPDFSQIQEVLASNLDMFLNVLAGYATYNSYKYRQERQETYLSKARLETSVWQIAKTFGYNINRFTAPIINFKYNSDITMKLELGTVIGTYKDYSVIYFGKDKVIEKGDIISFHIGNLITIDKVVNDDTLVFNVKPQILKSIHNTLYLKTDTLQKEVSRNVENYLVYQEPIDFSDSIYTTTVEVLDYYNKFGLYKKIKPMETVTLFGLETDGSIDSLEDQNDLQVTDNFLYYSPEHNGSNGDTLEHIRYITPYYFSTLRRMVTVKDHRYILEAHPYIKSAYVERDDGVGASYRLTVSEQKSLYTITINGFLHIVKNSPTLSDIYNVIKKDNNSKIYLNEDSIDIVAENGRMSDYTVLVSDGLLIDKTADGRKPYCCTINCYYIKYDTTDTPNYFSATEMSEISSYTKQYKLVGTKLYFIPAQVVHRELKLQINLSNSSLFDYVKQEIIKIAQSYELNLYTEFRYGEFLAKISKIIYNDGIESIRPVIYVIPDQEPFDYISDGKSYLKFTDIVLTIRDSLNE